MYYRRKVRGKVDGGSTVWDKLLSFVLATAFLPFCFSLVHFSELGRAERLGFPSGLIYVSGMDLFIYFATVLSLTLVSVSIFIVYFRLCPFAQPCKTGKDRLVSVGGAALAVLLLMLEIGAMLADVRTDPTASNWIRLIVVGVFAIAGIVLPIFRIASKNTQKKNGGPFCDTPRLNGATVPWGLVLLLSFSFLTFSLFLLLVLAYLGIPLLLSLLVVGVVVFVFAIGTTNAASGPFRWDLRHLRNFKDFAIASVVAIFTILLLSAGSYYLARTSGFPWVIEGDMVATDGAGDTLAILEWREGETPVVKTCEPLGEGRYAIKHDEAVRFVSLSDVSSIEEMQSLSVE